MSVSLENQIWSEERRVDTDGRIVEGIIEWFENIKTRPAMFYGVKNNPSLVENGMYWFQMAFMHLGYKLPKTDALIRRNLHQSTKSLERQLRERDLSDEEIVIEIIEIEIEGWKRLLKEINDNGQS